MDRGLLWRGVADRHPTDAPAADGSGVLLEEDGGGVAHMVIAGPGHATVRTVGDVPDPGGQGQVSFNAMTADYAAFVYSPLNGDQASFVWQMWAWDRHAGTLTEIAHNPVDAAGHALRGGWVQPVLAGTDLYWIQAAADSTGWGGSALVRYSLTRHTQAVVYHGLVTSFVPYRNKILMTALTAGAVAPTPTTQANGPPLSTYTLDPGTRTLSPGPAGVTAGADAPNTMTSDGDLVLWSTDQVVRAWRASWGRSITLIPDASGWPAGARLGLSGPTYVRLYGRFVIWNPGANYVLDLVTNSFAQLQPHPGSDELAGSIASLEQYTSTAPPDPSAQTFQFDQVLLDLRPLPDLPACSG
jgi:hypothetical protein